MVFNCDNTLLCDSERCDAAAIVRHSLGLRGKGEKVAADIGNAFHAALQEYFLGESVARVEDVLVERWREVFPDGAASEERFALGNCVRILRRYCEVRPVESFPFEVVEAEEVKGVPLTEEGEIMFWMKRDLLVRDKMSKLLAPVDHKTTGKITDWWAKKFRMLSQLSGYCWGTAKEFGQPVEQCFVNAIELGKLPDSSSKCKVHKVPYSECGAEHAKFELFVYQRTPAQLKGWRRDAIIAAKNARMLFQAFPTIEYLPAARRNGAFTEGCTFCEFAKWCAMGFPANAVDEFCIRERWEPWKGAEGGK